MKMLLKRWMFTTETQRGYERRLSQLGLILTLSVVLVLLGYAQRSAWPTAAEHRS